MNLLDYQKHPIILAVILATIIALFNYISLSFFFDYSKLIIDVPLLENHFPQPQDASYTNNVNTISAENSIPHTPFTIRQILTNFLLAFILFYVNFYTFVNSKKSDRNRILKSMLLTFIITTIFCIISIRVDTYIYQTKYIRYNTTEFIRTTYTRDFIIGVIANFVSTLMFLGKRQQEAELQFEALKSENLRSQYNALASQLDPHFLFNSLNTLKGLISSNPNKAQEYTQQLSEIFRFTINHDDIITLEKELDFCQSYSEMMLIRYENNLTIKYNIDPKYYSHQILPFSIQTLIENAIKHNIITTRKPLTIEIYSDNISHIIVRNNKSPKKDVETTCGLGLKNLNDRYLNQFQQEIEISNTDEYFEVKIPII